MRLTSRHRVEDAHEDAVWTARWSADSLITGSVDETVKVWVVGEQNVDSTHTYTGMYLVTACTGCPAPEGAVVWEVSCG